jgi:hypothetical protein
VPQSLDALPERLDGRVEIIADNACNGLYRAASSTLVPQRLKLEIAI